MILTNTTVSGTTLSLQHTLQHFLLSGSCHIPGAVPGKKGRAPSVPRVCVSPPPSLRSSSSSHLGIFQPPRTQGITAQKAGALLIHQAISQSFLLPSVPGCSNSKADLNMEEDGKDVTGNTGQID